MEDTEPDTLPFDHIGATLAEAHRLWRSEYERRMVALGQPLATEAATQALAFVPPEGASQAALGRALGVSKQAAQQFVDRLLRQGLVTRSPDPQDHRAQRVRLTDEGRRFVAMSNEVKAAIEAGYRAAMGKSAFAMLRAILGQLPRLNDEDQPSSRRA